ncbi:hypothetical protein IBT49_16370 [Erwinia sp. S63]|uniref:hypothetical protein n=1 Tax=Erwinia sp. S63 TaxID=2769341 RepID=UPI00190C10F1|nr:hypothetical protein [Erwinia sp. S63]MBK0097562.1 hypothetical protein [Erwinia sp. S63]
MMEFTWGVFTISLRLQGYGRAFAQGQVEEGLGGIKYASAVAAMLSKEISEISGQELNRYYLFHIFNIDADKYVIPVIRTAP